jgi:PPM family protein phosphatase
MLSFSHAGVSDVGPVRAENQDRWCADPGLGLYLVADGMGGESAGALASEAVVEVLPELLKQRLKGCEALDASAAGRLVADTLAEISEQLWNESRDRRGLKGMGATVVLALIRGQHVLIAHLGDSRAYLLHEGELRQLTKDHSIVQLLVDCGEITPEEATNHPARGQLTRYVGASSQPLVKPQVEVLVPGDRLLLCSDGLSGGVSCEQIAAILNEQSLPDEACRKLVAAANTAGGKDNVTVVVIVVGRDSNQPLPAGVVD